MPLSFGIKTSQMGLTYQDILRAWQDADEVPVFGHAWLWDHMVPLRGDGRAAALEAWTLLGALAAQTRRLRLGVMVTSNRLRNPALLAKMAATVDVISGGRLDFGIGAGGSQLPGAPEALAGIVRREFEAYGVPIVSAGEAVTALDEACTMIRRMWTGDGPFDFAGRHYQLRGAVCEPKPVQQPHPPFVIGPAGSGPRSGWPPGTPPSGIAPPAPPRSSGTRAASSTRTATRSAGTRPRSPGPCRSWCHPGDPAASRALLLELIEAGATHLVLAPVPPWPDRPARWLADEVAGPVAAQLSPG